MESTGQIVGGVDFFGLSTHDLAATAAFYRDTLGLRQSVMMPERNYAEFETGNLTLSLIDGEKMGIGHHVNHNALALHVDDTQRADTSAEGAPNEDGHH